MSFDVSSPARPQGRAASYAKRRCSVAGIGTALPIKPAGGAQPQSKEDAWIGRRGRGCQPPSTQPSSYCLPFAASHSPPTVVHQKPLEKSSGTLGGDDHGPPREQASAGRLEIVQAGSSPAVVLSSRQCHSPKATKLKHDKDHKAKQPGPAMILAASSTGRSQADPGLNEQAENPDQRGEIARPEPARTIPPMAAQRLIFPSGCFCRLLMAALILGHGFSREKPPRRIEVRNDSVTLPDRTFTCPPSPRFRMKAKKTGHRPFSQEGPNHAAYSLGPLWDSPLFSLPRGGTRNERFSPAKLRPSEIEGKPGKIVLSSHRDGQVDPMQVGGHLTFRQWAGDVFYAT